MEDLNGLARALRALEGKGYGAYKGIRGRWRGDVFVLSVDWVQGDPFAAPSRVSLHLESHQAGLPARVLASPVARVAAAALLARRMSEGVGGRHGPGSGRSGVVAMASPGQLALPQTALRIHPDGGLEARLVVGLPARGRRILGDAAADLLTGRLPGLVQRWLAAGSHDEAALVEAARAGEDADALREQLEARGLVAFVADGAVLPRRSGVDDRPLEAGAVPFESPPTLRVTLQAPNAGAVTGMGVPRGVTLVVGGGFHGKSTLLRALEAGVYNHLPGDGRERVVTRSDAVKIRAEDGRAVAGADISSFIGALPSGDDTSAFSSPNASGSTSQASALVEALELGSRTLLMDEDTCATNFLIRDRRMQALVPPESEPITPLVDRVRELLRTLDVSTVLVLGGSGDYLDVADTVVAMDAWHARDRTERAREVAGAHPTGRSPANPAPVTSPAPRRPAPGSLPPGRRGKGLRVRVLDERTLSVGDERLDLAAVEQLVLPTQLNTVAAWLASLDRDRGWEGRPLAETVRDASRALRQELDGVDDRSRGDLAWVRPFELAAALNRLRSLTVLPAPDL